MNLNFEKIYSSVYDIKNSAFDALKDYFSNKYVIVYFVLIFFTNICLWLAVWKMSAHSSQNLYVLHYNADFGVDLIGEARKLYVIPQLGLFIFLLDGFLPTFFLKRSDFNLLSHVFLSSALLCHLFLIISLFSLYIINFQ